MKDCTMQSVPQAAAGGERQQSRKYMLLLHVFCLVFHLLIAEGGCQAALDNEVFSEDLLLRPLSDGKVLSHFYFKNGLRQLGSAGHHHVFPKAISQLVKKFHIREMELSFTQGRWNYERWGAMDPIASSNAKPLGVELWAAFDVPLDDVDSTWRNLTHALSGLFCASINFLESPASMAAPEFSFRPDLNTPVENGGSRSTSSTLRMSSGWVRYGALPRESVCTENLTPWLKLLPCRDKAGISTLLDRPSIYKGYYHSLRVHLCVEYPEIVGSDHGSGAAVLEQTLTLVLQPAQNMDIFSSKDLPKWSLSSVFGRQLEGSCPLAKTSHVMLELEGSLLEEVISLDDRTGNIGPHDKSLDPVKWIGNDSQDAKDQLKIEVDLNENVAFSFSPHPDLVYRETRGLEVHGQQHHPSLLLDYWLQKYSKEQPLNLGLIWKRPMTWPTYRGPFRVSRFLGGSGNQKGSILIQFKSNGVQDGSGRYFAKHFVERNPNSNPLVVSVFHLVPWYVRLYTHTLTTLVDGFQVPLREIVTRMRVVPAEDRLSPAVLEILMQLPVNISMLSLNIEFDKGFLHIDEHPPDANRGFDLPSALIKFPTAKAQRHYAMPKATSSNNLSPLLQTLQSAGHVHIYSESLLVPLATPDFSMPYNVITFTCTVLALYFGSLLNTLRRRIGEEERRQEKASDLEQKGKLSILISRYMEGKSETQKKLVKLSGIVIIVIIAVGAKYILDMG